MMPDPWIWPKGSMFQEKLWHNDQDRSMIYSRTMENCIQIRSREINHGVASCFSDARQNFLKFAAHMHALLVVAMIEESSNRDLYK